MVDFLSIILINKIVSRCSRLKIVRPSCAPNESITIDDKTTTANQIGRSIDAKCSVVICKATIDYYQVRDEEGPFPESSTSRSLENNQKNDTNCEIAKIFEYSADNKLLFENGDKIWHHVTVNINILRTLFSSDLAAETKPL